MEHQQEEALMFAHGDIMERDLQRLTFFKGLSYGPKNELIYHWNIAHFDYWITMSYEAEVEDDSWEGGIKPEGVRFITEMPNTSWISLGFGDSMTETDMISWNALAEDT